MILICAGNHEQARYYAKHKGLERNQWRYIHSSLATLGLDRDTPVILYGTYYDRNDWRDINQIIAARFTNVIGRRAKVYARPRK